MINELHPKLEKNLYDLSHARYLQRSHTIANFGCMIWLAFLGSIATYLIEGSHQLTDNTYMFILLGTSVIGTFFFSCYWHSRVKRFEIVGAIEKMNSRANKL